MKDKKKVIIAIIITIVLGTLTILGSFALWTTVVGNNINVDFNTVALSDYIEYTAGKAVFSGNVEATSAYPEGIEGTYTTFKINKKNNPAYPFYAGLKMKINSIGDLLTQSRVLKWTVTSKATGTNNAETVVAESDFVGTSVDDTIILVPNIEVTTASMDYNVYIWVDSNNSNASLVEGENIEVEIWMDVYQYRAPKVLDAFCYNDGTTVSCNVLDSEKLLSQYGFSSSPFISPVLYTNISTTDYWTSLSVSSASADDSITVKTSDNREKTKWYNSLYQLVKYIESTGTQYIDTEITPDSTTDIEVTFMNGSTTTQYQRIYGQSSSGSNKRYQIEMTNATSYSLDIQGTRYSKTIDARNNFRTIKFQSGTGFYLDNSLIQSSTLTETNNYNIWLFMGRDIYSYLKMSNAKLWKGGSLVRNFVAAYRKSDNVAGLYEAVDGIFYTNANSNGDNFVAGPDV